MGRPLKLALLAFGTLVFLGVLLLGSTVRRGFSTHEEPSRIEATRAALAPGVRVAIQLTEENKTAVKVKIGAADHDQHGKH